MPRRPTARRGVAAALLLLPLARAASPADDPADVRRRAQEFHLRAQERTGVLVPLYVYPADIHTNPAYNRLIDLKRRHETVPAWVVLNPASGPGGAADANYTRAVDRLRGAGCVVLGYAATRYGKRPAADVRADIDRWRALYTWVQGVFFDEMTDEDTDAGPRHQAALSRYAHDAGFWPAAANPGAETPAGTSRPTPPT